MSLLIAMFQMEVGSAGLQQSPAREVTRQCVWPLVLFACPHSCRRNLGTGGGLLPPGSSLGLQGKKFFSAPLIRAFISTGNVRFCQVREIAFRDVLSRWIGRTSKSATCIPKNRSCVCLTRHTDILLTVATVTTQRTPLLTGFHAPRLHPFLLSMFLLSAEQKCRR